MLYLGFEFDAIHATHPNWLFFAFQAVLLENDTMAIGGRFEDGIPVAGEIVMSKIVNVNAGEFPIQLEFAYPPCETDKAVNLRTPQIVYKVAICPKRNLPYIQITSIVLPYIQSTNYLLGTYL